MAMSCYRMAVRNSQGKGMTKYTGEKWVWPVAYVGARKAFTDANEPVSLICNNRNGRFYQIGIPELWVDREDDYGGGYEIECKLKLKERTAPAGEYEEIEHVESHIHIRPFKETYRDIGDYDSNGFREDHSITVQIYEDGEPSTASAKLEDISRYGDYIFRKRIEARRLQIEYLFATAAWRIIKTQELYMPINKAAGPLLDYPSESQWQYEYRSADLWISRDRLRPNYNRATGKVLNGSYDVLTTGPDGQSNSAISMAVANDLQDSTLSDLTGDFTISMWIGDMAIFPGIIYQSGTLIIMITELFGIRSISVDDGINSYIRQLSWISGWVYLVVQRSGNNIKIYEDGVSIYFNPMIDSTIAYDGNTIISNNAILSLFDVRRIQRAISSEAIAYYYDQIINNGKLNAFLPINR